MIPAGFEYHRPRDLEGVLALLDEHGDDARVMAGGHSLIPMMKLRMADVPHLIDLQAVDGLAGIEIGADEIRLGAMVTQTEIIGHAGLAEAAPILREAALQIADPQVRNMGTVGGNIANGDPGNDMPGLMQCLDARFTLVGSGGVREVAAREFYEAAYMTAREDEEVLTAVTIPRPAGGHAYEKQKRKIGDYATAAAAVQIAKEGRACASAAIAMTNLSDTPVFSEGAGAALVGTAVDAAALAAASEAMLGDIDPTEDNRGPVAFKRHVAGVILRRAIERAWSRA
ncbi:FAD binding domain-containing protein [Poseidonocella sedimentorum]|uniref:Carbon monoxide dehydrogenase, medium subunit n=1 Tax=Poseidonocella sedimentorum TaxID=871652 RepID=A0A1I6DSN2_9RHOB|nr:xanthine dehydrogenase family protein subunit M [Poseidonocella sedimentorum]SFR08446.1 carbon monoxide dehydrogenase, medium subunit [Poseidonocella sedimentorum]